MGGTRGTDGTDGETLHQTDPRGGQGDQGGDPAWSYPRIVGKDATTQRARIRVGADLPGIVAAAGAALVEHGETYQRGARLVDVLRTPDGPVIRGLGPASLRLVLARAADWCRVQADAEGGTRLVLIQPPSDVALAVCEAGAWPVPSLAGISSGPLVRPDGTVASAAGYDPMTRWWSEADPSDWIPDPSTLCREVADVALDELRDLLRDYPVATQADRSSMLSGLLTAVARTAIVGPVPLHLIHATTPGSGKTLWVDVVSLIATGSHAARMPPSDDEDEERKRITSILLSGAPVVLIDNVSGAVGSTALDAMLTASVWTDRVLGSSEMIRLPVTCSIYATGNNVSVRGDLARRTIPARLEPTEERPEARADLPDLEALARTDRARLLRSALTVVLSYLREPERIDCRTIGSYSAWSRVAREPLIWLGMADPLEAQDALRGIADYAVDVAGVILSAVHAVWGDAPWTAREIASREGDVRAAIEEAGLTKGRDVDARGLGYWLRRTRGRVVGGLVLDVAVKGHDGIRRWRIRRSVTTGDL